MNTQKKLNATLLVFAMIFNLISPIGSLLKWKKVYGFEQEIQNVDWKIEPIYSPQASLYGLPKKIIWYKKAWTIRFSKAKDMIFFKFGKQDIWDSDLSIFVNQDWLKKKVSIDDDWDERMILEDEIYTSPIFSDRAMSLDYEIQAETQTALTASSSVIWVNTSDFSEKLTFWIETVSASDDEIISRADWWADETLKYEDNPAWVKFIKQQEASANIPKADWQKEIDNRFEKLYSSIDSSDKGSPTNIFVKIKQEYNIINKKIQDKKELTFQEKYFYSQYPNLKIKFIRKHLSLNFPFEDNVVSTIRSENWHKLVWPIEKTKRVEKIVVHHTAEAIELSQRDDAEIIRWIYRYHSISKRWWDIWYNYIVWRDGKIYEWRAWWDYAVAAHNLWNNKSTVGISVMWNFEDNKISNDQKNGADKAIWLLSKRFGIDLNNKSVAHKECGESEPCLLKDYQTNNLVWHKDAWSTSCPWKNLYALLGDYREYWKSYSSGLTYIDNTKIESDWTNLKRWPMIKIRLSYTWSTVDINSYTPEKVKITLWNRSWYANLKNFRFEKRWNDQLALVVWNKTARVPYLTLSSTILEVNSWNRKPSWDKTWLVNDNKFRWSITIRNDNWNIVLINELPLEDYLKWLAEISNDENPEKAKTILVAARSYALWYTDPANRKFPWKPYDWSDNPDEFQKYLGYSFEMRGNNIWQYVADTNEMVIKYSWKLIKPWYFNQSNGKTKSYLEYCEERKINWSYPISMKCEEIPYLAGAYDPAWIIDWWYKWHWVWISWAWAKYLAEFEGMKYDDIIKYFLKWVTVEKTAY
ncbi:MAG: hypothetical protein ACD_2C00110G0003 [uncultured bacterium (gcode 4)]|uniref:Peptidoglycan recognition protein family domain-containing protein n=1 Tax=uncultured bacterium (gcode 4) TaxID=1234023 RepID=K2G3E6_9BACT|nr:MAG: hypothetical protein ACD_2C00110G0003 [uncultured bacterium (gcode 4)]